MAGAVFGDLVQFSNSSVTVQSSNMQIDCRSSEDLDEISNSFLAEEFV